ncbi:unnamed protein product [Diatraea saccharalis]|uniref:DRBM domain-containing protein n=1 Tax=Diatraea saccharalis TaxID=40085 RepID=A0A9N9WD37_9NEOP|nr:unnamed protein product [Diatraea saccharalis]
MQQFKVEPADATNQYYKSQKTSFCADLTLDGITYKGYGENKLMARNAAAEQAIRDMIIKRMQKAVTQQDFTATVDEALSGGGGSGGGGGVGGEEEEPLPMIQLASFALHKLFSEWEFEGHKVPALRPPSASTSEAEGEGGAGAGAGVGAGAGAGAGARLRPAKKAKEVPGNAAAMHPCMLLTYMRPHLEYRELAVHGDRPQHMTFTMGVDVDGATYIGKEHCREHHLHRQNNHYPLTLNSKEVSSANNTVSIPLALYTTAGRSRAILMVPNAGSSVQQEGGPQGGGALRVHGALRRALPRARLRHRARARARTRLRLCARTRHPRRLDRQRYESFFLRLCVLNVVSIIV